MQQIVWRARLLACHRMPWPWFYGVDLGTRECFKGNRSQIAAVVSVSKCVLQPTKIESFNLHDQMSHTLTQTDAWRGPIRHFHLHLHYSMLRGACISRVRGGSAAVACLFPLYKLASALFLFLFFFRAVAFLPVLGDMPRGLRAFVLNTKSTQPAHTVSV
jgi:hypothetical protein